MRNPLLDRFRGNGDNDQEAHRPAQPAPSEKSAASGADEAQLTERRLLAARLRGEQLPNTDQPPGLATADQNKKEPPLTAARVGTLAEQRIQAAIEEGMFDNLDGAGQPLNLYDDMHIPSDMRMAFRLMKGQNLGAPWVEPQRDYERQLGRYLVWRKNINARWASASPAEQDELRAELALRIKAINNLIHSLNALVPTDTLRVGLLVYERELHFLET
ncbi:MAG: DUF1992 domain-containing protein [Herpetosiphonaceae bacterium]|nr:DUF1992 domain-containing protein [Herpetosiphonaceae bacterium]